MRPPETCRPGSADGVALALRTDRRTAAPTARGAASPDPRVKPPALPSVCPARWLTRAGAPASGESLFYSPKPRSLPLSRHFCETEGERQKEEPVPSGLSGELSAGRHAVPGASLCQAGAVCAGRPTWLNAQFSVPFCQLFKLLSPPGLLLGLSVCRATNSSQGPLSFLLKFDLDRSWEGGRSRETETVKLSTGRQGPGLNPHSYSFGGKADSSTAGLVLPARPAQPALGEPPPPGPPVTSPGKGVSLSACGPPPGLALVLALGIHGSYGHFIYFF